MTAALIGIWVLCAGAMLAPLSPTTPRKTLGIPVFLAAVGASLATVIMARSELWAPDYLAAQLGLSLCMGAGMTLVWRRRSQTAAVALTVVLYGIVVAALLVWMSAPGLESVLRIHRSAFLAAALGATVPIGILYRTARIHASRETPVVPSIALASLIVYSAVPLAVLTGWSAHLLFTGVG